MAFWNRKKQGTSYADPNCGVCRGTGQVYSTGSFLTCGCVARGRARDLAQQDQRLEDLRYEVDEQQRRARAVDPDRIAFIVNGNRPERTPEQQAADEAWLANYDRISMENDPNREDIRTGRKTNCCSQVHCKCGLGLRMVNGKLQKHVFNPPQ